MKRSNRGMPSTITEGEELIQRAIIRLTVRQGSFEADKSLGSRLYTLNTANIKELNAAALNLTRQALLPLNEVFVENVNCIKSGETLHLSLELRIYNKLKKLEVNLS